MCVGGFVWRRIRAMALGLSGWPIGILISTIFAVRKSFGDYRGLYCMVPSENYDVFGFIIVRHSRPCTSTVLQAHHLPRYHIPDCN